MKLLNITGPQDVMALLVRRKWWIALPFVALSCTAVLLVFILPKMYVSSALILIQPRDVPSDLVRNLIAGTTNDRLSAIEQMVLSRTALVQVANEFESQLPEYKNLNMDDRVAKLRHQIDLNFRSESNVGSGNLPLTSFRISFQDRNPEVAQKIAVRITALFLQQDNEAREKQVSGTTQFFSDEVDKVAELLKASDAKLKQLKSQRQFSLPSQSDANLRRLESLGIQRTANSEQLQFAKEQLRQAEDRISSTPKEIPKQAPPALAQTAPAPPDPKVEDLRAAIAKKKAFIAEGKKESHPDVQGVNIQLDRLKKDMTTEEIAAAERKDEKPAAVSTSAPAQTEPNPNYQTLMNNREGLLLDIKVLQERIAQIDKDTDIYTKRLDSEPQVDQELSDIVRENTNLNKQYEEYKGKLAESKLSESLESKQKGDQFRIIDQPNLPLAATKPQKYVLSAAGVGLSLLLSIAFGAVVDIANQKMWTLSDVESLLGATVLVEIPEIVIESDLELARRKRLRQIVSVFAGFAVYGVVLYFVYLHQASVLRHLDPYLQRLYQ